MQRPKPSKFDFRPGIKDETTGAIDAMIAHSLHSMFGAEAAAVARGQAQLASGDSKGAWEAVARLLDETTIDESKLEPESIRVRNEIGCRS